MHNNNREKLNNLEKNATLLDEQGHHKEAFYIFFDIAKFYHKLKFLDDAEIRCKRALEIAQKEVDERERNYMIALSKGEIGLLYLDKKNYVKSIKYLEGSLKIYKSEFVKWKDFENMLGVCTVLGNIALNYMCQKLNEESMFFFEEQKGVLDNLMKTSEKMGDQKKLSIILEKKVHYENNIAEIFKRKKQPDLAEKSFDNALEIMKKLGMTEDQSYASTLISKGVFLQEERKDYGSAFELFKEALMIYERLFQEETEHELIEKTKERIRILIEKHGPFNLNNHKVFV